METLNTHIEDSSAIMETSETHSEKAASDEEDFKLNIPYFDGASESDEIDYANRALTKPKQTRQKQQLQQQQQQQLQEQSILQQSTTRSNYDLLNQNIDASADDDDGNQQNFSNPNWDNDDLMGSDYSAQSSSASPNLFSTPGPPNYYGDPNEPDIKYTPPEILLQPPTRYNTLQFDIQPQQVQFPRRHLQTLPPPPHLQHMHAALQHRHHHQAHHHPQYGGSGIGDSGPFQSPQQPPILTPPGYHHHPNMWYPNAPYGTSRYSYEPHRYPYQYGSAYGHDPVMDMLQLSNSGREARNRAEKNRRDKLNGSIQELSTMVPHVAESPRRVDKTAVLRFAAHGLRLKYVFGESLQQQRTQITDPLMKLLDSFFITLTCHGQIVLISSSIEQHLGHCQADLYGQNILHIAHPEDHSMLKHQLIPTDLENLFDAHREEENGEPKTRTQAEEELIDKRLREDKRSFTVRLARAGPRSEPTAYEVVRIEGCFRRSDAAPRGVKNSPFPSSLQLIRRSRGRDDSIPLHTISGNDIVLIAIARIIRPPKAVNRIIESNSLEYKTRHLIDGRIIDCDQRIGIVAGYMTDEVRNLSPFTFMHQDDVRWVIVALRQMYDCNSSYGESTYRLLSRNGNFIYLQTRGYLEIDKNTNKVHSFVCINTLLDEDEGKRRVEDMKRKFSIIIKTKIPPSTIDAPASDNPQQLEKAVMRLIQNLQKTSDDEENYEDIAACSGVSQSPMHHSTTVHKQANSNNSSTKTPPLALVPPEASSVKSSILKSVSVVNITSGKSLRGHQRLKSPLSTTEDDDEDEEDVVGGHRYHMGSSPPNLIPACTCRIGAFNGERCDYCRRYNYTQSFPKDRGAQKHKLSDSQSSDGDNELPQKRIQLRQDEEIFLPSPLESTEKSLNSNLKNVLEESEQFEMPFSDQGSVETEDEQSPPAEIFLNVQNEYEIKLERKLNNDANTTNLASTQRRHENDNISQR